MVFKNKNLSIKSRLMLMLILVCLLSASVLIYIGYITGKKAITEGIFNQLTSVKNAKKYQIESYFLEIGKITETLAAGDMVKNAIKDFRHGYRLLSTEKIDKDCSQKLSNFYLDFVQKVGKNIEVKENIDLYYPNTIEACYLQHKYIVENQNPLGKKNLLQAANDGSEYSKVHNKYHQTFNDIVQKFGFYDLFLIDVQSGEVLYSTYKEVDFATNLYNGPFKESNLSKLATKLKTNSDVTKATFVDFEIYRPSYGAPAGFVGIPIIEDGVAIGGLVIQLPIDEVNKIMTGNGNWEKDGLGKSGETYLVGEDFLMRSVSRFFLEDTFGFTKALVDIGVDKKEVDKMYRIGTTVLNQRVKTEGVLSAISGKNETKIIQDYRFSNVLSSYAPLQINGLKWFILSEIDESEVNIPIKYFQKKVFIALCIIILLVTFLAMFLASRFVKPIEKLSDGVKHIKEGDYSHTIDESSNDEFGELAKSFNTMTKDVSNKQKVIDIQLKENQRLLLNFVPSDIVKRLQNGEKNIVNSYPNVSLISIDISGFSKITDNLGPEKSIQLLNDLIEAFDGAAAKNQVEKIRTVGDTYFASCGIYYPRLDHTKKIFDFALETRQLMHQFNINQKLSLKLHIGIHCGEILAGIVGVEKFNYDLWGTNVNKVFYLRNEAMDDEILVSNEAYIKLSEDHVFDKIVRSDSLKGMNFEMWQYMKSN